MEGKCPRCPKGRIEPGLRYCRRCADAIIATIRQNYEKDPPPRHKDGGISREQSWKAEFRDSLERDDQ